jgi:hypothetical protein
MPEPILSPTDALHAMPNMTKTLDQSNVNESAIHPVRFSTRRPTLVLAAMVILATAMGSAFAQQSRPAPADPQPRGGQQVEPNEQNSSNEEDSAETPDRDDEQAAAADDERAREAEQRRAEREQRIDRAEQPEVPRQLRNGLNRRNNVDDKVILAFNDVNIAETIPFIVETTGKVVLPINLPIISGKSITLVNDEPIDRQVALDMLFTAFRLNDIAVVEKPDMIILNDLNQIIRTGDLPVLQSRVDVMNRTDRGTIVIKIFKLVNANAEIVGERIAEMLPDYASMSIDPNSNQIVLLGDIGLMQQVQKLINELDDNYIEVRLQTFRLAHADANEIAANIEELFEGFRRRDGQPRPRSGNASPLNAAAQQAGQQVAQVGPQVEMRVTVNAQNNAVTVQGDPECHRPDRL